MKNKQETRDAESTPGANHRRSPVKKVEASRIRVSRMSFAQAFNIDRRVLAKLGCFNPVLQIDTNQAIDPLLLEKSRHSEMNIDAKAAFNQHFRSVCKLLAASKSPDDPAWLAASKMFQFPEIRETRLGMSKSSIAGHGVGVHLRTEILKTSKAVVDFGIDDPTIFPLLAILEDGIGPDLISDMTTNVILVPLFQFTKRMCDKLSIPTKTCQIHSISASLPISPVDGRPIILVPADVLREVPVAADREGIARVVAHNEALKKDVNALIMSLFLDVTKAHLKRDVLKTPESVRALIRAAKAAAAEAVSEDPLQWSDVADDYVKADPLVLSKSMEPETIVEKIVDKFRDAVENKGLWKSLWDSNGKSRHEPEAQRLFYAIADAYCDENNLDITPEANHGVGPVDFKFSRGYMERIVVELKLSTNQKAVDGYQNQLERYKKSANTKRAIYLVVDLGRMGSKKRKLALLRNRAAERGESPSKLEFVDGRRQKSASKA